VSGLVEKGVRLWRRQKEKEKNIKKLEEKKKKDKCF
jgi:hypothetical protein